MNEEDREVRVRWHPYDGEREGLPPDSHEANAGERVLWFEWDLIR